MTTRVIKQHYRWWNPEIEEAYGVPRDEDTEARRQFSEKEHFTKTMEGGAVGPMGRRAWSCREPGCGMEATGPQEWNAPWCQGKQAQTYAREKPKDQWILRNKLEAKAERARNEFRQRGSRF